MVGEAVKEIGLERQSYTTMGLTRMYHRSKSSLMLTAFVEQM
jgi:hypothetical protein